NIISGLCLNMIKSIDNKEPVQFTRKTYPKDFSKEAKHLCEKYGVKLEIIDTGIYRSYYQKTHPRLEKGIWGYKFAQNSTPLAEYTGTKLKTAGFSTESGGYGGGWIKSGMNVPLSTKDVHTCALLNLVNKNSGEQLLYHVYEKTGIGAVKALITKEFPRFTEVNIMPGDNFKTNTVVNNILDAVNEINPKAAKHYYHASVENPEIVAIDGKLEYIKNIDCNNMTFTEVTNQYNY
ncbi:MAG: hypothetical protein LUB59_01770, partial [Candidatus Gastranaerophilales bacterium]|nr:hypothetical protein [Candidatus Gastranaerophilales bacterium]